MSDYQQFNSLEWLNENMARNYPIVGTAESNLPTSFLVDIQLVLPFMENVDTSKFFISRISRTGDSLQVTIGYLISDPSAETMTGFDCAVSTGIPVSTVWPYLNRAGDDYMATEIIPITDITTFGASSYSYGIPENYSELRKMSGMLYIGTCVDLTDVSSLQFTYNQTAIIPVRVYMQPKPGELREVTIIDQNDVASTFTDKLTLVIGEGLVVSVDEEHNTAEISIDSQYVEDLMNAKVAELEGTALRSINGITPDDTGNIQIIGLDCTDIGSTGPGVITISNPCSKPCCDQNGVDSASISNAMAELIAAKDVLNNYYNELVTKVNSIQSRLASLIASRK